MYLYNKETKKVTYSEFINRELILFSNMDVERSIPSMVDGKYFSPTLVSICLLAVLLMTKAIWDHNIVTLFVAHSVSHNVETLWFMIPFK